MPLSAGLPIENSLLVVTGPAMWGRIRRGILNTMSTPDSPSPHLTTSHIIRTWWPLAASWLLMSIELPALSAVIARLAEPEINLAAYGGVVSPLALIIEAPIIMLLAGSTALSKDWASYLKVRRFMLLASVTLTALHILIAFTPLYYVVAEGIIGVPPEVVEPARIGLRIMTPWTWAIAYRRLNQGVLIRFDHSRAVGLGTFIRLSADGLVLAVGFLIGTIPGIVVASCAVILGVISEAVFSGLRVRPVIRDELKPAAPVEPPLTYPAFFRFYVPLALTSLIFLIVEPLGSAALSRMPNALHSLAVWPILSGLVFVFRSPGVGYREVTVALLDKPKAARRLAQVALWMAVGTSGAILLLAATPLSPVWFGTLSGLKPELARMAQTTVWLALPAPALSVLQNWYQGAIVNGKDTRGIPEAVGVFLVTVVVILGIGIALQTIPGLHITMAAFSAAYATQTAWLWWRSRPVLRAASARDEMLASLQPLGSPTK
jgi:Na+-driven multidrug efflux pump